MQGCHEMGLGVQHSVVKSRQNLCSWSLIATIRGHRWTTDGLDILLSAWMQLAVYLISLQLKETTLKFISAHTGTHAHTHTCTHASMHAHARLKTSDVTIATLQNPCYSKDQAHAIGFGIDFRQCCLNNLSSITDDQENWTNNSAYSAHNTPLLNWIYSPHAFLLI